MRRLFAVLAVLALPVLVMAAGPNVRENERFNRSFRFGGDSLVGGTADTSEIEIFGATEVHLYVSADTIARPVPGGPAAAVTADTLTNLLLDYSIDGGDTWRALHLSATIDSIGGIAWIYGNPINTKMDRANGSRTLLIVSEGNRGSRATNLRIRSSTVARPRCTTCTGNAPMRGLWWHARRIYR